MEINRFFICFLITFYKIAECVRVERGASQAEGKLLSRKKRYLVFPEGASMSVASCMTVGVIGNPQFSIFSYGVNYGFAYELPTNATLFLRHRDSIFGLNNDDEEEEEEPLPPPPSPPITEAPTSAPETTQPTQSTDDHHYLPEDSGPPNFDNQYLPEDSGPPLNFDPNQLTDLSDSPNSKIGYTFPWNSGKINSLNIQSIPNRRMNNQEYQRPFSVFPQRSYSPYASRPMLQRRYRRELYNKFEIAMDK